MADAAATRNKVVVGTGAPVAVIGDSYVTGYGLQQPSNSWPRYLAKPLHARILVNGFAGSGFTDGAGHCRGVSYLQRATDSTAQRPRLVIVEGGLNEVQAPSGHLASSVRSLSERLDGTPVVVVGPTAAPALRAGAATIDARLAAICAGLHVPYISAYRWRLPFAADQIHLTARGHRLFARHIASAVTDLRLTA